MSLSNIVISIHLDKVLDKVDDYPSTTLNLPPSTPNLNPEP